MQNYRCKCGESIMFGSTPPLACQGCDDCNTTYAQHPDHHSKPKPHEWITKYNKNTDEQYEVCSLCYIKK